MIQGPVFGGAHNQLVRLREPLAGLGVEIEAALSDDAEAAANRMRAAGLATSTLPLGRLRASRDPRLAYASSGVSPATCTGSSG